MKPILNRQSAITDDKSAFTLIELLVVVAIIALLVSILIPSLENARSLARKTVCASNMHQVGLALSLYGQQNEWNLPRLSQDSWTVICTDPTVYESNGVQRIAVAWSPLVDQGYIETLGVFYNPDSPDLERYRGIVEEAYNADLFSLTPPYVIASSYIYSGTLCGGGRDWVPAGSEGELFREGKPRLIGWDCPREVTEAYAVFRGYDKDTPFGWFPNQFWFYGQGHRDGWHGMFTDGSVLWAEYNPNHDWTWGPFGWLSEMEFLLGR